jgi:hypothetical protein
VHSIGFRRARPRNRIEVTVKGHLFTCDQLDFIELKSKVVRMVALLSTT